MYHVRSECTKHGMFFQNKSSAFKAYHVAEEQQHQQILEFSIVRFVRRIFRSDVYGKTPDMLKHASGAVSPRIFKLILSTIALKCAQQSIFSN